MKFRNASGVREAISWLEKEAATAAKSTRTREDVRRNDGFELRVVFDDSAKREAARVRGARGLVVAETETRAVGDNNHHLSRSNSEVARDLDEFVTALSRNHSIRKLTLANGVFLNRSLSPTSRVWQRFFGVVLPTHPSLHGLFFHQCQIDAEYVVTLARATLQNSNKNNCCWNLQHLRFHYTPLDLRCVMALADLLRHDKTQIQKLELPSCGIESTGCQALLDSLNDNCHNSQLQQLVLCHNNISTLTWSGAKALGNPNIKLRCLKLRWNPWTCQSLEHLALGLRTTQSLEELYIRSRTPPDSTTTTTTTTQISSSSPQQQQQQTTMMAFGRVEELFRELLTTYNLTLRVVWMDFWHTRQQQRVSDWVQCNHPARITHYHLKRHHYHVVPSAAAPNNHNNNDNNNNLKMWPDLLASLNRKPSLLYRFVRLGNLDGILHQQLLGSSSIDGGSTGNSNCSSSSTSPQPSLNKPFKSNNDDDDDHHSSTSSSLWYRLDHSFNLYLQWLPNSPQYQYSIVTGKALYWGSKEMLMTMRQIIAVLVPVLLLVLVFASRMSTGHQQHQQQLFVVGT